MRELVGEGQQQLVGVRDRVDRVDRHLEAGSGAVDRVDERERLLGHLAVGFEAAEQHQVAELSLGSDRGQRVPRVQDRVVVVSEAQFAEFAVHDDVGGGEHELLVSAL